MVLGTITVSSLAVSSHSFNGNGLAVVYLSGNRYGGDWIITVSANADGPVLGQLETSAGSDSSRDRLSADPAYPDIAIRAAYSWLLAQVREHQQRVVGFTLLNDRYGPDERPYCCLAEAVLASRAFSPAPGVAYADEIVPE